MMTTISASGTSPRTQAGVPSEGAAAGALGRPRLHQSSTSKKPIQPSSVNSLTWAWNMYWPG